MEKLDLNSTCWRCGADQRDRSRPIPENTRGLHNYHSRAIIVDGAGWPRLRRPDCGAEFPSRRF